MAACIQSVQAFRKPYPPSLVTVDHFHTCVYGLYSLRVAVPLPPREMGVSPRGGEGTATRRLRPLY